MSKYIAGWILGFLFHCSFSLSAQESIEKIEVKDVSFSDLIDVLEKVYKVNFSFQSDLLNDQLFSLHTSTPDLTDVLQEITAIYNLEYQILNDQSILLREKLSKSDILSQRPVHIVVLDHESDQPMPDVAVGMAGTSIGAYTDEQGVAELFYDQPGDLVLEAFLLGYESKSFSCASGNRCEVRLHTQSFSIDEVMIQDRVDIIDIDNVNHSVSLNSNSISALSSGLMGKDILRQTQLLSGVAAFNDISAGLQIRGAEEQSSLIIIDDIPVYNASHYYGLFGAVNPSYSTGGNLYKNNLPIDYDGKTAGMLHINGPQWKDTASANGTLDINLLSVSGALNIPIYQNAYLSVAGRTSYNNVSNTDLFSLFDNRNDAVTQNFSDDTRNQLLSSIPDFTFYDLNARFQYIWNTGKLTMSYFQSLDDLDDTFENSFTNGRNQVRIRNTETYSNLEKWKKPGFQW